MPSQLCLVDLSQLMLSQRFFVVQAHPMYIQVQPGFNAGYAVCITVAGI